MAGINAVDIQVGLSVTPANNFVLDASADDGTLILRDSSGTALMTMVSGGEAESYARDNILGTVSESAGVPTGAIIESGSNANGEYTKYADGTQICRFRAAASAGSDTTWTFPATFVGIPHVLITAATSLSNITAHTRSGAGVTTLKADWGAWTASSGARAAAQSNLIAIGRWF